MSQRLINSSEAGNTILIYFPELEKKKTEINRATQWNKSPLNYSETTQKLKSTLLSQSKG